MMISFSAVGGALLTGSLALSAVACVLLVAGWVCSRHAAKHAADGASALERSVFPPTRLLRFGAAAFFASSLLALACILLLAWCFLFGDTSIRYVAYYRSDSTEAMAWLFKLAGIWGGSEGSLLLWALMIALFGCVPAARCWRHTRAADGVGELLDALALAVLASFMAVFLGFCLFSPSGQVFAPIEAGYVDGDGNLVGQASLWGLSALLEHWAMAIHPPLLFVGYAGLSVPFAYAVAALLEGDTEGAWMRRVATPTIVAWLFLSLGIGTGAVWAYSVLGWGGYWGWDAVENASLLPWLACVAFLHSLYVYRRQGSFGRWTLLCACLLCSLVGLDAFITRSGIIGSVHAFAGNEESLVLFGAMTLLPLAVGCTGLFVRRKVFVSTGDRWQGSMFSREAAFYVNNVFVLGFACVIAYATLAPALPSWLPLGGLTLSAEAYNSMVAPLAVAYLLLMALCPLLGWMRTSSARFARNLVPVLIVASMAFSFLLAYWVVVILPVSSELVAGASDGVPQAVLGPMVYRNGLALAAFLAASLCLGGAVSMARQSLGRSDRRVPAPNWRGRLRRIGAACSHGAMAVLLVGLVGSVLYVSDKTFYITVDHETGAPVGQTQTVEFAGYRLDYEGMETVVMANRTDMLNTVRFSVLSLAGKEGPMEAGEDVRAGKPMTAEPSMQVVATTKQTHFRSAILALPLEDLFVIYKGAAPGVAAGDSTMQLAVEVRVNRLVSFVWMGFALFVIGVTLCVVGSVGDIRPVQRRGCCIRS